MRASCTDSLEEMEDGLLGAGGGGTRIKDVARDQQQIHGFALKKRGQMIQACFQLVKPVNVFPNAPGVPVACVHNLHGLNPSSWQIGLFRLSHPDLPHWLGWPTSSKRILCSRSGGTHWDSKVLSNSSTSSRKVNTRVPSIVRNGPCGFDALAASASLCSILVTMKLSCALSSSAPTNANRSRCSSANWRRVHTYGSTLTARPPVS